MSLIHGDLIMLNIFRCGCLKILVLTLHGVLCHGDVPRNFTLENLHLKIDPWYHNLALISIQYTTWRLRVEDMQSAIVNHKSF